jgi:hypothetical protein
MKILNGIVGVLLDATIHCCCLCLIGCPIPLIRNWIMVLKIQNVKDMISTKHKN